MKSKKYGNLTVLIPDQEAEEQKIAKIPDTAPVVKNLVYQVRIDDEAYMELTIENQKLPNGFEPVINIFARKYGSAGRKYISSIRLKDFGDAGTKGRNVLTDEAVLSIYRRIMEEEELFWFFYQEAFGQSKTRGTDEQ